MGSILLLKEPSGGSPWAWPVGLVMGIGCWANTYILGSSLGPRGLKRIPLPPITRMLKPIAWAIMRPIWPLQGLWRGHILWEAFTPALGLSPTPTQMAMIRAVMELGTTTVREVMVPRIDIVAVPAQAPLEEVARILVERGYSRLPVYQGTIDNVIGIAHAREVLRLLVRGVRGVQAKDAALPAYFVPQTKRLADLLTEMQRQHLSIAIVIDEYGGTAGLVTVEDVLEEIVGELIDEFDMEEEPVQRLGADEALVNGRVAIDILEELFGIRVGEEEYDTIGGLIYHRLGRMPTVGDQVEMDGLLFRVVATLGRRIRRVYIARLPAGNE